MAPTVKQRLGQLVLPRLPITRFLFDQLRTEANAVLAGIENRLLPSRRHRLEHLRKSRDLLVNVACGPQVLEGFANFDLQASTPEVIRCDCRRGLPLESGSASGIRAEQFFEHLEPREESPAFLRDCLRILQPGGVLRVIVPDAERFLHAYCQPSLDGFRELAVPQPFPSDLPTRMDVVNHMFHQWHEHRWGYDFETLTHRLRSAGFGRIERTSFRRSLHPRLGADLEIHSPYSLYVDAVKDQ
jgi:predicted SAM-dependent methyltransferase